MFNTTYTTQSISLVGTNLRSSCDQVEVNTVVATSIIVLSMLCKAKWSLIWSFVYSYLATYLTVLMATARPYMI